MALDLDQGRACFNTDRRVLLVAPPGSGKTTVLLAKIDYLLNDGGVDPGSLLVLTFSRSASQNLKERFSGDPTKSPFFGTIHSFAFRVLSGRGNAPPKLIGDQEARNALAPLRRRYGLSEKETAGVLSGLSRERCTGQKDPELPEPFRQEAMELYDSFKAEGGFMDFDDLEDALLKLLEEEGDLREIAGCFRWVLVDEFQDLNRVQLAILKKISWEASLFCVGDEDQSIYGFRGSDAKAMIRFRDEFPGGSILYLRYNYRSSATVVRHANALIRNNRERYLKEIRNFRQDETAVQCCRPETERAGWADIAVELGELSPGESSALIFRTNAEAEEAAHFLSRKGIRFVIQGRRYRRSSHPLYQKMLLPLCYCSAREGRKELFVRMAKAGIVSLPEEVLLRLAASPALSEEDLLKSEPFGLSLGRREELSRLFRDLGVMAGMKPAPALRYLLYGMGLGANLGELARETGSDLGTVFLEAEELIAEAAQFDTTEDLLHHMGSGNEILTEREGDNPVMIITMHGAKGMEFDRVYILNAVEGTTPHEKSLSDLEGERRLFYVALTRARHRLIIHSPLRIRGRPAQPSRFLAEAGFVIQEADGPVMPEKRFSVRSKVSRKLFNRSE